MTPTLLDIAKETNTSVSTVSRVLAGGDVSQRISAETRHRVLETATRMGYRPNLLARSLRTRRSYSIALVVPDISRWPCAGLARDTGAALHRLGYSLVLCNSGNDEALEREFLDVIPRRGVDGLIIIPQSDDPRHLAPLTTADLPFIVLGHRMRDIPTCLWSDPTQGANLLADKLESAGVKSIALLQCAHHGNQAAYASVMRRRFKVIAEIDEQAALQPGGTTAITAAKADAVVCTNCALAEAFLMGGISQHKPSQILACFDADPLLLAVPMPLICCNQNVSELAEKCVQQLMELMRLPSAFLDSSPVPMVLSMNTAFQQRML